jgi:hypothetical protein
LHRSQGVRGVPPFIDRLYEAGLNGDETLVGGHHGHVYVDFDRGAKTLGAAVATAIDQVERAGYKVARVEIGR